MPRPDLAAAAATAFAALRRPHHDEVTVVLEVERVAVRSTDHEPDLLAAGYVIDEVLPYATNTAWVRATDGSISHGLRAIGELGKLPGVAAVEPEMIGTSASR